MSEQPLHKPKVDIQGRFSFSYDFMTDAVSLKVRVEHDGRLFEAIVPFRQVELAPIRYHEGG